MQLASLTYEGDKKKNDGRFIIPAYVFNGQSHTTEVQLNSQTPIVVPPINYANTTKATLNPNIPIISKTERTEAVSNFSIKSVHLKTEHQRNFKEVVIDPNTLPRESFQKRLLISFGNVI